MRQEAEQQTGDEPADMGDIVDERQPVSDIEIEGDPEEELSDQALRPRLVPILRRTPDREDERAQDTEDRTAGADAGGMDVKGAGNPRADAAGEVDQREAFRSEQHFVESAE